MLPALFGKIKRIKNMKPSELMTLLSEVDDTATVMDAILKEFQRLGSAKIEMLGQELFRSNLKSANKGRRLAKSIARERELEKLILSRNFDELNMLADQLEKEKADRIAKARAKTVAQTSNIVRLSR